MSEGNRPRRWSLSSVSHHSLLLAAGIVVTLLLLALGFARCSYQPPATLNAPRATTVATPSSGLPTVTVADLPPEARGTLVLIDKGGPFWYKQDNTIFGNNEGRLPERPRGYYHEYTVPTPGSPDRGARRLIAGEDGDIYYTDDHYDTFRQVIR